MPSRVVTDAELLAKHEFYFKHVGIIWMALVVELAKADRRFRLTIDESYLNEISIETGAFVKAVRRLINAYEDDIFRAAEAADRVARSNKLDAPGSLGLLAACVLVASNMTADDGFSAAAYYPRFNRDVLGVEQDSEPYHFSRLREKWVQLANIIRSKHLGQLMIPRNPNRAPIKGRVNINYPVSQCLFRRTDIDRLAPQLREWSENDVRGEAAFEKLLTHVRYFQNVSSALMTNLKLAQNDPDVKEAYSDALDDLITDAARHIRIAKRVTTRKTTFDAASAARLRIVPEKKLGRLEYDIVLDVQRDDKWVAADFRCEAADVIHNTLVEIDGTRYRYLGDDPQVFLEEGEFDIITQRGNKLPSFAKLVVVSSVENKAELLEFASKIRTHDAEIRDAVLSLDLLERFSPLCAVRFTLSAKGLNAVAMPELLNRYNVAAAASLHEVGGLKIGGDYLVGFPPRLELNWDSIDGEVPVLFCDEVELEARQLDDRLEYDLSEFSTERGTHFVTSSDAAFKLVFKMVDPEPVIRQAPAEGAFNALYFGPEFLRFLNTASIIKKARQQALTSRSKIVLMHGAWFVTER